MGQSGECEEGVGDEVAECRGGTLLIAAWAVGGGQFLYACCNGVCNSCEVEPS